MDYETADWTEIRAGLKGSNQIWYADTATAVTLRREAHAAADECASIPAATQLHVSEVTTGERETAWCWVWGLPFSPYALAAGWVQVRQLRGFRRYEFD